MSELMYVCRCGNGLMVETTAWEGVFDTKAEKEG